MPIAVEKQERLDVRFQVYEMDVECFKRIYGTYQIEALKGRLREETLRNV